MDNEIRDDQLVAAVCHASVLVPLMGVIVPIAVWLSQRERSMLLRFQALQALTYQMLGILAYFIMMGCYMAGMFSMFPMMAFADPLSLSSGPPEISGPLIVFPILLTIVMVLFFAFICLGGPIYIITGLIAAWNVLKGREFLYPLIGKRIAVFLESAPQGK
ncbi:MAG: DUF4870 domain-containing protein [Anaerolineae bacterium]|nr:DUF4870 domain-containing protein [Anaerolineae bacterium]